VARVSSVSDEIAGVVTDALETVGKEGQITVEEGALVTDVEYKDGLEIDGGFFSSHFVTNQRRMEAELVDPYVLVIEDELSSQVDLMPFFKASGGKLDSNSIVVVSPKIERGALGLLVQNHVNGNIKCIPVKGPKRRELLEDICVLTGATLIGRAAGISLQDASAAHVGRVKKVMATKDQTVFVADRLPALGERIEALRVELQREKNPTLKERLENRIAKLVGGIAVISVGAASEVEMKEKVERVKDAVGATQSALEMGIVPGGGVALIRCVSSSPILNRALEAPLYLLAKNAGKKADFVVEEVRRTKLGYNVYTDTFEDLIKAGIIDPVKVTIHAVIHAVSVSAMMLTTDVLVAEHREALNVVK